MNTLSKVIALILFYFLTPAILSATARVMRYRGFLFLPNGENVFDFWADIMYPWR